MAGIDEKEIFCLESRESSRTTVVYAFTRFLNVILVMERPNNAHLANCTEIQTGDAGCSVTPLP